MIATVTAATAVESDSKLEKNDPNSESFLVISMRILEIMMEPAITLNKVIKFFLLRERSILRSM
jgi:hypothetical protein